MRISTQFRMKTNQNNEAGVGGGSREVKASKITLKAAAAQSVQYGRTFWQRLVLLRWLTIADER